jgi:hypothetical protein
MDKHDMMPVKASQATMWTLSADRKLVRLAVPQLRLASLPEPLDVHMDFDAKSVDAMLERLTHPARPDAAAPAGAAQNELGRNVGPARRH